MEIGKHYETKYFTLKVIDETHLVYFTTESITKCHHAVFDQDKLTEISEMEYRERLDKTLLNLKTVEEL